jgi:hypothetical protein
MNRVLLILLVCVVLLGCRDQGVEPQPPPVSHPGPEVSLCRGVVAVIFTEGTTAEEAEQLVKDLGLSFKFAPTGSPLSGVISVPVGSEDEWVVRLKTYPIVKSAGRIGVVTQE